MWRRAFAIRDRLERNPDLPLKGIAEAEGVSPSYATRALRLAYLAPDIVTAILDGRCFIRELLLIVSQCLLNS